MWASSMPVRHPCILLPPYFSRSFSPSQLSFRVTGSDRYAPMAHEARVWSVWSARPALVPDPLP